MNTIKKQRLENAGWKVGSAQEFLGLTNEEAAFIEIKLALAASLQKARRSAKMTQADLAKRLGSSQSRVAKMEAADASVSIDLLVTALLALGTTRNEIGRIVSSKKAGTAA